jgi:hypothetical protein
MGARICSRKMLVCYMRAYTPFYIACAQIWAVINDWVVPPIKARGNRISCCFLLHFLGFLDFLNLLRFNPFFMRFTARIFFFPGIVGRLKKSPPTFSPLTIRL